MLLATRFDVKYVQDQVGHADADTTLQIYAQVGHRRPPWRT
jgi:integrase